MPRRCTPTAVDPTVTVSIWSGPLTALAARVGMEPRALAATLNRVGHRVRGNLQLELQSPVALTTLRRVLTRRPEEGS